MQAVPPPKYWRPPQKFSECFYIERRLIAEKSPASVGLFVGRLTKAVDNSCHQQPKKALILPRKAA
jgi:hypothetical protein